MKKTIICVLVAVLLGVGSPAHAERPFDPAAQAKVVAPFVEEATLGVVRVDFSRIDTDAVAELLARVAPDSLDPAADRQRRKAVFDAMAEAGLREIYFVITMAGGTDVDENLAFAVVPLPPDTDRSVPADRLPQAVALKKHMGGARNFTAAAVKGDVLVAGTQETIDRLATITPDARPELEKAFAAAGPAAVQVLVLPPKYTARVLAETMPELPERVGGGPSSVLTRGCLWGAAAIDLPPAASVRATIQSADADAAKALGARWEQLGNVLERLLHVEKRVPEAGELWAALGPRVEGDRLLWTVHRDNGGTDKAFRLLAPVIEDARQRAYQVASMHNLRRIGIALHNHHDRYRTFPAAANYDKNGRPLLSWRVHILPWMEGGEVYREFHLDEPWDSPHNKKLIARMPSFYRRSDSRAPAGTTTYLAPVGPGMLFAGKEGHSINQITDGTSNTAMVVDADDSQAVPWTKPDDWHYDSARPLAGLIRPRGGAFCVLMADGSSRVVRPDVDPELWKQVLTIADGEPVNKFFKQ